MAGLLALLGGTDPTKPPLSVPTHCPECGHPVKMEGEFLVCPNTSACPAQVAGTIKNWIKKLNILDWGGSLIEALCAEGLVVEIPDLYSLTVDQVADVRLSGRRVGESTAKRVLENLHAKKTLALASLVGSLNIPMIGRSNTKTIVTAGFDTLPRMVAASKKDIASIDGMGEAKAEAFVDGIQQKYPLIQSLLKAGVEVKGPAEGALKGKLICMTGFRDPEMEEAIEDCGGTVKSSVSRKLDYLVAGDVMSTSGKAKKARGYGVEIISQDDMWELING